MSFQYTNIFHKVPIILEAPYFQDLPPDTDRDGSRIFISWYHPRQRPLFTFQSLKSAFTILMSEEEKRGRKRFFGHFPDEVFFYLQLISLNKWDA